MNQVGYFPILTTFNLFDSSTIPRLIIEKCDELLCYLEKLHSQGIIWKSKTDLYKINFLFCIYMIRFNIYIIQIEIVSDKEICEFRSKLQGWYKLWMQKGPHTKADKLREVSMVALQTPDLK